MEPPPQERSSLASLAVLRQLLGSYGDSNELNKPPTTGEVLNAALALYKAGITDPVTEPAAFGMAVAIVSTNLEVSIRAAALILSTMIDLDLPAR